MKKLNLLVLLLTATWTISAQPIWNTLITEPSANDGIIKMIKTNDGGFAVLLSNSKPLHLYKFNDQGELDWDKEHDFSSTANNIRPKDMVELPNGNFAIIGSVNIPAWYQFLFIADSGGDSLDVFTYPDYEFFRELALDNNELLCVTNNDISGSILVRLNLEGDVIEEYPRPSTTNRFLDVNNQAITISKIESDSIIISRYSFFGDLELEVSHLNTLELSGSQILQKHTNGNLSLYGEAMLILDNDFNILKEIPADTDHLLFSQTTWQLWPEQVLATSDGGFLLTGYSWDPSVPFWLSSTYLIKLDVTYEIEWKHLFTDPQYLPLNSIPHTVEVDDGYVFVGIRENDYGDGQTWIVKINKEGIYTATEEVKLEPFSSMSLKVYPNPCSDNINITFPKKWKEKEIIVYDGQGNLVIQQYVDELELNLDLRKLITGLYYVKVVDRRSNEAITTKFIKI